MKIKKILIANRGEIACRIIHTCKKMGIHTVAIYAEIERHAKHVKIADEAYLITGDTPTAAYLNADKIISCAKQNKVDAIHPGYGFLSETTEFAQAIIDAGLIFIGAPVEALELMGSKAAAKQTMIAAGVPCVPGYHDNLNSSEQDNDLLQQKANNVGYPLLIKASAGGGGKGMKIVNSSDQFSEALNSAKREALKSFGNDHVILERFITQPKHIEVQVFADSHGNVVHLFERDCSSQRRYQKIVEEAPATCIGEATKNKMYQAALAATKAVNYQGAGTIEFIVQDDEFFFMEMNTRLQVEHRVTEMITGTDLVEWQILVASGEQLPLKQDQIKYTGHAIQARIYAEDSFNGFLPATGLLEKADFCTEDNTIIDTGIEKGSNISIYFDPMIAKIVCWSPSRTDCIEKVLHNLDHTFITGVKTNLGFLSGLISSKEFINNTIFTNALDNASITIKPPEIDHNILANLISKTSKNTATATWKNSARKDSAWAGNNGWSNSGSYSNNYSWLYNDKKITTTARINDHQVLFANNKSYTINNTNIAHESTNQIHLINNHQRYIFDKINHQTNTQTQITGDLIAPMPGKILEIKVKTGDKVQANQTLLVMEAMKMELSLKANSNATVLELMVNTNDVIAAQTLLVKLDSDS